MDPQTSCWIIILFFLKIHAVSVIRRIGVHSLISFLHKKNFVYNTK